MNKPRAYTEEETREQVLDTIHSLVDYWDSQKVSRKEAIDGVAFSILSMLDGSSMDLPGFRVMPICPKEDKEYFQGKGENYYDESVDIAGCLHEYYHKN